MGESTPYVPLPATVLIDILLICSARSVFPVFALSITKRVEPEGVIANALGVAIFAAHGGPPSPVVPEAPPAFMSVHMEPAGSAAQSVKIKGVGLGVIVIDDVTVGVDVTVGEGVCGHTGTSSVSASSK